MPDSRPAVIDRYFIVAAERDTDAFMALFTDDADVVDEGLRHRGSDAIRLWRDGVASPHDYTTTITSTVVLGDQDVEGVPRHRDRVRHQLRIVPEVSFYLDDTVEYADKMDKLFHGLDIPPAPAEDDE